MVNLRKEIRKIGVKNTNFFSCLFVFIRVYIVNNILFISTSYFTSLIIIITKKVIYLYVFFYYFIIVDNGTI